MPLASEIGNGHTKKALTYYSYLFQCTRVTIKVEKIIQTSSFFHLINHRKVENKCGSINKGNGVYAFFDCS